MSVVKVDSTNEGNFQARRILPKGRYPFEIANDLKVEQAQTSGNNIVKIELRCQAEDGAKGVPVFDNCVLTPKGEWKLCQLALSAGVQTAEEIKTTGVDLELLKGKIVEAEIDVEPARQAPDGTMYNEKNKVSRYLFEA